MCLSGCPTGSLPQVMIDPVIRITPNNAYAMAPTNNTVIFVDLVTGQTSETLYAGGIGDIEISFDGSYAFVSGFDAEVIDIASQTIVNTLSGVWGGPAAASLAENRAVSLNPRVTGDHVYLFDINGADGFREAAVLTGVPPEGDAPRSLAISSDGTVAVAVNYASYNVAVIALDTGQLRAYVPTGEQPLNVAIAPDGGCAVVTNLASNTVSIIDLTTDMTVATLATPAAGGPTSVLISHDSQFAYVRAGRDLYFILLDGAESAVVDSVQTGWYSWIVYTYNVTSDMALNPDGSVLALCVRNNGGDDELLLIDAVQHSEIVRVPVGDRPVRVRFSHDGSQAYVVNASSDDLYIVNITGESSHVAAIVPGIDAPWVEVDASDSFVYAGNFSSNAPSIKVVDTLQGTVVKTLALNDPPRAAHLSPCDEVLYVATTGAELVRIRAGGEASEIIDVVELSGSTSGGPLGGLTGPSDMVFSEALNMAVVAHPPLDGIDLVQFGAHCPEDFDNDGAVGPYDLAFLLGFWGPNPGHPADLDCDETVGPQDLALLLGNWGACK